MGEETAPKRRRTEPGCSAADAAFDRAMMLEAVALGNRSRVTAPPNPWVGCVLVGADRRIIGRGYHRRAGMPHAEVEAIQSVPEGISTAGSTCYVTLEPCSHRGRTGPCCEALHKAGVSRVVVACMDPDDRVSGKGCDYLRRQGIAVTTGVCTAEAAESLKPYLHQRQTGLPFVVLKTAVTLDGNIACRDGTSQWITGDEARRSAHLIRAESQAIVVGSGTALADNPRLTVRGVEPMPTSQPLRVLLDRRGRVRSGSLLDMSQADTIVVTSDDAPAEALAAWEKAGVCVKSGGGLRDMLRSLADRDKRGVLQVMVEGGGAVHSAFLREGLCDKLVVFVGATMFGDGRRWLSDGLCSTIADARFYKLASCTQHGNDVRLEYERL
eukprot:TRINITY_DN4159_c0_g1_i1.p1 TRINITY_DN4159_c0_g1~~TRINITY_DN4159_c0_g1_i1.p1  ORF type:complete len:401 (+),score=110.51 TRINITY_DN4159_c0_g1_i1:56-1204(+)